MSRTSGLPWAVHVFPREGEPPPGSPRQVPLLLVLALVAVALVGGWTAIFRSLSREQRVAALQSDFIAAVSHEFRSPLTALSHASELLLHDRLSSDTSRREIHEVLARDSQRLRTLVEDLLEFGRLENGATPFSCEDTDLGGLVRSTIDACQQQVAPRGYVITTSGDLDDVHASVDREALSRALRNLLDNAVKYSPDCREIHVTLSRDEHSVRIAVSDRGLGIPLSEQATVFDRFVRGAESKRRRIPGTGIGLVMVRQIVRAHGGDVHLTSEPGRGSTFTVVLRGVRGVRLQPDLEAPGNPAKAGSHRTA
jgi:signal transduction histidine kinase